MKGILLATFFLLSLHGVAGFCKLPDIWEFFKPGTSLSDTKASTTDKHPINFTLFYSSNSIYSVYQEHAALILNHAGFDPQKDTCFIIHGLHQNIHSQMIKELVPAMLKACNVIVVDWSYYSCRNFFIASFFTVTKCPGLATAFKSMVGNGLNWATVHFIGFSLGAHCAGIMCKELKNAGLQCRHIIGSDPAGVIFNLLGPFSLTKEDAEFVETVQGDRWVYGQGFVSAHLIVRPGNNGHRYQPGCDCTFPFTQTKEDACSHIRSWELVKYATVNPGTCLCRLCDSGYLHFIGGKCNHNKIVDIGLHGNASSHSGYCFMLTSGKAPYCQGVKGATGSLQNLLESFL